MKLLTLLLLITFFIGCSGVKYETGCPVNERQKLPKPYHIKDAPTKVLYGF